MCNLNKSCDLQHPIFQCYKNEKYLFDKCCGVKWGTTSKLYCDKKTMDTVYFVIYKHKNFIFT